MDAGEAFGLLMTPAGREDPYPTYDVLRGHGRLLRLDERFFLATGYAVIGEVMRDPRMLVHDRDFVSMAAPDWKPGPAGESLLSSMLQRNEPDHARLRRLVAGAFTPRRMAAMREAIAEQAHTLAETMTGPVDFMAAFAYPLPVRMICTLLGVPAADQDWFRERAIALTALLEPQFNLAEERLADLAMVQLNDYFTTLVQARRDDPRDDLTTALVQTHDSDGGGLAGDELLAQLVLLLVAGFETTTNLLGNGLLTLLQHPAAAEPLRADPGLAERFVEEILRFDSPVQVTSRWCREPVEVAGQSFPAGTEVFLLLGAGNRDPERFAEPALFNPGREANQPLSFGAGAHYCLGAALARLEAQVAFPILLQRFPDLALAGEPERRDRLTLRGYASLPIAPKEVSPKEVAPEEIAPEEVGPK